MEHFPLNKKAERWLDRRAAEDPSPPDDVLPENDEFDPTIDWLAHLAAGRIQVRMTRARARRPAAFAAFRNPQNASPSLRRLVKIGRSRSSESASTDLAAASQRGTGGAGRPKWTLETW